MSCKWVMLYLHLNMTSFGGWNVKLLTLLSCIYFLELDLRRTQTVFPRHQMVRGMKCCCLLLSMCQSILNYSECNASYITEGNLLKLLLKQCLDLCLVVHEGGNSLLQVPFKSYGPCVKAPSGAIYHILVTSSTILLKKK